MFIYLKRKCEPMRKTELLIIEQATSTQNW